MMGVEKTLVNVNKGQDPYSVIGNYIRNHITAIEDMIAVIQVNEVIMNELFMVDMDADGYFYWNSDWWEGEEDVALLDYFPVSEAERKDWIPCSERLPEKDTDILVTYVDGEEARIIPVNYGRGTWFDCIFNSALDSLKVIAWMPLPEAYREGER